MVASESSMIVRIATFRPPSVAVSCRSEPLLITRRPARFASPLSRVMIALESSSVRYLPSPLIVKSPSEEVTFSVEPSSAVSAAWNSAPFFAVIVASEAFRFVASVTVSLPSLSVVVSAEPFASLSVLLNSTSPFVVIVAVASFIVAVSATLMPASSEFRVSVAPFFMSSLPLNSAP